ncbi:hypothetical protein [Paraburkholderia kururiensis]|uniref:hypothetical protein n=1 Tax=Paraburkholderia kururiensis TaxID=984307 RepID=UPI000A55DCD8|nr:hypothetical protein [Paraburkholderia kururiensis]
MNVFAASATRAIVCAAATIIASAASAPGQAQTQAQASGSDASQPPCAIGVVSGIGGAAASMREYLATPDRDKYRYLADNPLQCRVSDEGRTSGCTGVTNLRRERVSVYDDIDSATMSVVARVELEHGTYPAIIVVRKQDVQCEQ